MPPPTPGSHKDGRSAQFEVMALPASTPASLLWAQQLKRENTHLLVRMKDLETQHQGYNARIKSVESIAEAMKDTAQGMKQLSMRIDVIEEDDRDVQGLFERLVGERLAKIEKDFEKVRKTQHKMSALETQYRSMETEVEQASSNHDSMLKTIEGIEAILQKQQADTERLIKKSDSTEVRALMLRMDAMESRRTEEASKAQAMQDRFTSLEQICQAYNTRNNELHSEVARLKAVIEKRPHVLPSSEATTELPLSNLAHVQIPASPLPRSMNETNQATLVEESPTFNAQQRKTARIKVMAYPSQQDAQVLQTQLETQSRTQTPDLDILARHVDTQRRQGEANASRKRKPSERRKTRNQAKSQVSNTKRDAAPRPSKIVILKVPRGRFLPSSSKQPAPKRPVAEVSRPVPNTEGPLKKRKRRQIPQFEDMEAFLAAGL